jgi:GNAT superfamily N-acetyltransferase
MFARRPGAQNLYCFSIIWRLSLKKMINDKCRIQTANDDDSEWIANQIKEYESRLLPDENVRELRFIVKDENNKNIGGLLANTRYSTLYINDIWIIESERGTGLGKRLIQIAEDKARGMGCSYSSLGTFEILNVKGFYQKLGYRVISISKDSPKGHIGYWFVKKLI